MNQKVTRLIKNFKDARNIFLGYDFEKEMFKLVKEEIDRLVLKQLKRLGNAYESESY